MLRRRPPSVPKDLVASDPPRLVLRFAVCTGIGLALAAAAILLVVRHFDTVQAERGATAQARVLASTVLRESLQATDFQRANPARRAELDDLFANRVLDEGVLLASLVAANGIITYSTDHRLIGTRIAAPEHAAEARQGIVRGDVASVQRAQVAPHLRPGRRPRRHRRRRHPPGLRADRARRELDVPAGRRDLRGRADPPLRRARADPPARHPPDPTPDGRDPAARPLRRGDRAAEPDALPRPGRRGARPPATWGRSCCCSTSTTSRRSTTRSATSSATSCCRASASGSPALCERARPPPGSAATSSRVLLPHGSAELAEAFAARIHEALERAVRARRLLARGRPRASASPSSASTGRTRTRCSSTPTSRCTSPRARTPARPSSSAEQDTNDAERLALAGELRRAIEQEELVAPLPAEGRPRRPAGSSASRRSSAGSIPSAASSRPTTFIPHRRAHRPDQAALDATCCGAALDQAPPGRPRGSTSTSPSTSPCRDLLDLELPDRIAAMLAKAGVPAGQLELEITESTSSPTRRASGT